MAFRKADIGLIKRWVGGVDYDSDPFEVPRDCLIDASNILPANQTGAIAQRSGFLKYNNTVISEGGVAKSINGLASVIIGGAEFFLAQAGTKFYNGVSATWSDISGSCTFTDNYNNLTSFAVLENVLYFRNRNNDGLFLWSGTGNVAQVASGQIYSVQVHSGGGGNGYVVGDILTVAGGTGGKVLVTGITGAGVVSTIIIYVDGSSVSWNGSGYSVGNNIATTGGTGVGASIDILQIFTPAQAALLTTFNGALWSFMDPNNPLLGYFSDGSVNSLGNPATNFLLFDQGQGWRVQGAVPYGVGQMLVFKDKSVTLVQSTGSVPAYIKSVFCDGVGCVSHQSIVTLPGGSVMWWDIDDIYMCSGNLVQSATVHPVVGTPRLRNFFKTMVNPSRLQYVVGVYYQSLGIVRWWYSPKGKNTNVAHIDYHIATKSFWPGTTSGNAACQRIIANQSLLYSGDVNGYSYQQDYLTSDDGGPITANAQIPWNYFEGLMIRKKGILFEAVTSIQGPYGLQVDFFFDQSSTPQMINQSMSFQALSGPEWDVAQFDVDQWPVESSLFDSNCPISRLFKTFSANIHNSGIDTPWAVYAINVVERPLQVTAGT